MVPAHGPVRSDDVKAAIHYFKKFDEDLSGAHAKHLSGAYSEPSLPLALARPCAADHLRPRLPRPSRLCLLPPQQALRAAPLPVPAPACSQSHAFLPARLCPLGSGRRLLGPQRVHPDVPRHEVGRQEHRHVAAHA